MKCICFYTHLHENVKNAKKKRKRKKPKTQKKRKKTKTHILKNEDAYFQERRSKKTKTKTQILGERCQLSSGEYCTAVMSSGFSLTSGAMEWRV